MSRHSSVESRRLARYRRDAGSSWWPAKPVPQSAFAVPFPVAAHRTGRADLPHPALGLDSRLRPRHITASSSQTHKTEFTIQVRVVEATCSAVPCLVLV